MSPPPYFHLSVSADHVDKSRFQSLAGGIEVPSTIATIVLRRMKTFTTSSSNEEMWGRRVKKYSYHSKEISVEPYWEQESPH